MSSETTIQPFSERPQIPFVSVLLAYFFGGCAFVAMNAPLVLFAFRGIKPPFKSLPELLFVAIVEPWRELIQHAPSANLIFGTIFFSLVAGFLLKPLDQFNASLFTWLIGATTHRFRHSKLRSIKYRLFSPSKYAAGDYAKHVAWLIRNREARAHWEYEILLYIVHWSLCMNTFLFVSLSVWLLWPTGIDAYSASLMFAASILALAFSLAKSIVMGDTHEHYIEVAAGKESEPTTEADEQSAEKLTTSKLAQKIGIKTADLIEQLTKAGYLEARDGKNYMTPKGKDSGGEFHWSPTHGPYFLWPESFRP